MDEAIDHGEIREESDDDVGRVRSTLPNWGYYYALGLTLASDLEVNWRNWSLRGAVLFDLFDSLHGQDRFQFLRAVTEDFPLPDSRLVWRLSLGYRPSHTPIELSITAEGLGRHGRIFDISDRYDETRVYYRLNFVL